MKKIASLLAAVCLFGILPIHGALASGDLYANAIYTVSNQVYEPSKILGAPDQSSATFFNKDANIMLDMGAGEEGAGDLVLYFELLNYGAQYTVEFLNTDRNILQTYGNIFPLSASFVTIDYTKEDSYRYVRITSTASQVWKLDAVETASIAAAPLISVPAAPATTTTPEIIATNPRPAAGLLVKLKPETGIPAEVSSTVYVIGNDGKRHAFPNDAAFHSWFRDFSTVTEIDSALMSSYALGKNITVRPGTYLVKITTDPKVYAVETGGILRWVPSEAIALSTFGSKWKERVIDIPDVFFGNYKIGQDLSSIHPNGSVLVLPKGEVVYMNNSLTYQFSGDVMTYMRFTSSFFAPTSSAIASAYQDGGSLTRDPLIAFPY